MKESHIGKIFGFQISSKLLGYVPRWCLPILDALSSTHVLLTPEQVKRTLQSFVYIRLSILVTLVAINSLFFKDPLERIGITTAFSLVVVVCILSLINLYILNHTARITTVGYVQLVLDVLLATVAVYITQAELCIVLYMISIVGAALIFRSHGAVITAALSGICYAMTTSSILPQLNDNRTFLSFQQILIVYATLIFIALVSAVFSEKIAKLTHIALRQEQDLSELSRQQQQLFDDISEGILTMDLSSTITGINQAAQAIMGLTEYEASNLIGRPFPSVLENFGVEVDTALNITNLDPNTPSELELFRSKNDSPIRVKYSVRPMTERDGKETGKMVLLNDISRVRDIEEQLSLHERMTELLSQSTESLPNLSTEILDSVQMIGESGIMQQVFSLIARVANSDASVLISGESGTGKELIAQAIHCKSDRHNKPFVAINCGAIPENLIESELFGHKKGSFTGAVNDNLGLFRRANFGTLFLDEIGELPLHLQSKLLRVIQDKRVRAVGDVHDHPIDVRLISATNKDLRKETQNNGFREDLYYRLNVVNVIAPPLRDRKEDIPILVRFFIGKHSDLDNVLPRISPEALACLMAYPFPGNVRELENIIERALVLGGHAILPEHIPQEIREYRAYTNGNNSNNNSNNNTSHIEGIATDTKALPIKLENLLEDIERRYLLIALEASGGMKKQAAELLGLNFRSFRYRIKKYGLGEHINDKSDD